MLCAELNGAILVGGLKAPSADRSIDSEGQAHEVSDGKEFISMPFSLILAKHLCAFCSCSKTEAG